MMDRGEKYIRELVREALEGHIFYHGTIEKNIVLKDLFGMHMGTKKAAIERLEAKYGETKDSLNYLGEELYIHKFRVNYKNPIVINYDFDWEFGDEMNWDVEDLEQFKEELINIPTSFEGYLLKNKILSIQELQDFEGNYQMLLYNKGYDTIIYTNSLEDTGSESIIILNPKMVVYLGREQYRE